MIFQKHTAWDAGLINITIILNFKKKIIINIVHCRLHDLVEQFGGILHTR